MTEKELEKILGNEEFMESLLETIENTDSYINNKKPVYTLRECLESTKEETLKTIYQVYREMLVIDKKLKNTLDIKEMIDILEKEILRLFPDFLRTLTKEDIDCLNESLKNNEVKQFNITLLSNGFMYGFMKNKKVIYIVPNELKEIYQEYLKSDGYQEQTHNNVKIYSFIYLTMTGLIPKDILHDILINQYGISITKKEIKEIILEQFFEYKDYYSLLNVNDESSFAINSLLEIKEDMPYQVLDEHDLQYYLDRLLSLSNSLDEVLKKSKLDGDTVINKFIIDDLPTKQLLDELDLTKTQYKKVFEIMEDARSFLRYWIYNGKTSDEVEQEYWISELTFDKKPQNTDLETCLSVLSLDAYHEMFDNFEDDVELLNEKILNYAKEKAKEYNRFQIECLKNSNHNELTDLISLNEIKHGLVYFYEDDDKLKCIIPDEVIDIMNKSFKENLPKDELVSIYIDMNGVIQKEKLQELLKEYHNIDISIKELDYIVKELEAYIIKNKYYTWVSDMPLEDLENILILKDIFPKYQKADLEKDEKEAEFKEKVRFITLEYLSSLEDVDNVSAMVNIMCKSASFDKELFDNFLENDGIKLSEKAKRKIFDLYKEYKKYITIWQYNGYTVLEYADIVNQKKNKVGRNDPCPCGSGKKYKKCCGK